MMTPKARQLGLYLYRKKKKYRYGPSIVFFFYLRVVMVSFVAYARNSSQTKTPNAVTIHGTLRLLEEIKPNTG